MARTDMFLDKELDLQVFKNFPKCKGKSLETINGEDYGCLITALAVGFGYEIVSKQEVCKDETCTCNNRSLPIFQYPGDSRTFGWQGAVDSLAFLAKSLGIPLRVDILVDLYDERIPNRFYIRDGYRQGTSIFALKALWAVIERVPKKKNYATLEEVRETLPV